MLPLLANHPSRQAEAEAFRLVLLDYLKTNQIAEKLVLAAENIDRKYLDDDTPPPKTPSSTHDQAPQR